MQKIKRPLSITIISWFLILSGFISEIMIIKFFINHDQALDKYLSPTKIPLSLQYGYTLVISLIPIIIGIALLNGKSWGRILYIVSFIASLVIALLSNNGFQIMLIPKSIMFLVIIFFLYRFANEPYFRNVP